MARGKAENALVPVYRNELRKVLLEYLPWMRAIKKKTGTIVLSSYRRGILRSGEGGGVTSQ